MVLMCPPVFDAFDAVVAQDPTPPRTLILSPHGRPFDQAFARELAQEPRMLLLAGHYEGFDHRIVEGLGRVGATGEPLPDAPRVEAVSLGDFVLTGGELAALAIVDSVVRLLPGVLGDATSAHAESFGPDGLLDFPHYTRPEQYRGMAVPEVLRSGHHAQIARWRAEQARAETREHRPDLLQDTPPDSSS